MIPKRAMYWLTPFLYFFYFCFWSAWVWSLPCALTPKSLALLLTRATKDVNSENWSVTNCNVRIKHASKIDTLLHRKRMSPRTFFHFCLSRKKLPKLVHPKTEMDFTSLLMEVFLSCFFPLGKIFPYFSSLGKFFLTFLGHVLFEMGGSGRGVCF